MAGLQRSEISFRRQGSSGLIWDDKFLAGALNQVKQEEEEAQQQQQQQKTTATTEAGDGKTSAKAPSPITVIERNRSNGGQAYKTVQVAPAADPPSPKVSGCGFCAAFAKPAKSHNSQPHHRPKPGKRKS